MKRIFLTLLASALLPLGLHAQSVPQVTGGNMGGKEGVISLSGTPRPLFLHEGIRLTSDTMSYNTVKGIAVAEGHAELTFGARRLVAEKITYDSTKGTFDVENVRIGQYPLYVSGSKATGSRTSISVTNATVVLREAGPLALTLKARKVGYDAAQTIEAEHANVGVGPALPITLPRFTQKLNDSLLTYVTLGAGYRGSLGAFAELGLRVPVLPTVQLGGDFGYYSARGVMFGPSADYSSFSDPTALHGSFRTGYINDHGNKKSDLLNRPIDENRGYAEWTHQQRLADNLSLTAQLNYWRDSEIIRDFRPNSFFPVQQPDTYLESVYSAPNYYLSLFARFQPNKFHAVQERLPELRFDLLPYALPQGFYQQAVASVAVLREDPPLGGLSLESDRLDAYYALTRPINPTSWLNLTPVVGGRFTHYANTRGPSGSDDFTRVLGEVGFDAELRGSATFNYQNPRWKIDGLRHLVTPRLAYRYIPEGNRGRDEIPAIDRDVAYSSYLAPLGLGATRNIDDLHKLNTLRVGLDNTLQTRDPAYGSRDLVRLNTAADFRFQRAPGERDLSEVHAELAVMPARWLQFDLYQSVEPRSFTLRELNTGLLVRDGDAWWLRFSNNFLRRDTEDYSMEGAYRVSEAYEVMGRLHYDARTRRFVEQSYGLRQNLANQWNLEYAVTLYDGPRRESKFGLRVQVDLIKF